MSKLYDTTTINALSLPNRFIRSATWEGLADEQGGCTPRLIGLMTELAQGEVGLIITGHAYVSKVGQARPWQLGIHNDQTLPGLKLLTRAVHDAGGKIFLQISHAGFLAIPEVAGQLSMGPSVPKKAEVYSCREMTQSEIQESITAFTEAAARAQKAGFDGVQIHAAHHYLLAQFLSPFYNNRSDDYGGNVKNRARTVLEILQRTREAVGASYPVVVKMNSEDFLDGGFSREDMLQVALMLEEAGIDAIELSGGTKDSGRNIPFRLGNPLAAEDEVYYRDAAKEFKNKIRVPLILVGGIRSFEVAEKLVEEKLTDYISLSRPLIREPLLVSRWEAGDKRKATCISCNLCYQPILAGRGISCVVEETLWKKQPV